MKKYETKPFDKIITDFSSRELDENMLQYSENIFLKDGKITQKFGTRKINTNGFTGLILSAHFYRKISNEISYIIFCTASDILEYDKTSQKMKYRTRCYNSGTTASGSQSIAASGDSTINFTHSMNGTTVSGSPVITGIASTATIKKGMLVSGTGIIAGSKVLSVDSINQVTLDKNATAAGTVSLIFLFDYARYTKTSLYKISFDSSDPDECTRWFTVKSIVDIDTLSITGDGTLLSVDASAYCLRLCYYGGEDDNWSAAYPYYDTDADKRMLLTNGMDYIQEWNGDGFFFDSEYPNFAKHVGYFGGAGGERVITSHIYDNTTASYNSMMAEFSNPAEISWGAYFGFAEFFMTDGILLGALPLQDRLVFYKNSSISVATNNTADGTGNDPFILNQDIIKNTGAISMNTIVALESAHLFFSGENFFMFDGINCRDFGGGVIKYILNNINKKYLNRSFSAHIKEEKLYLTFVAWGESEWPSMCIAYNYEQNCFMFWRFKKPDGSYLQFTCKGKFSRSYVPSWSDFIFTKSGCSSNGTSTLILPDTEGLEINMKVEGGNGTVTIPDGTYIASIPSATTITLNDASGTAVNITAASDHVLEIGFAAMPGGTIPDFDGKWVDMMADDSFTRLCLCSTDGEIFEFSRDLYMDYDNNVNTLCTIRTKNFEFNAGNTSKILGTTIGISPLFDSVNGNFILPAYFDIRVSVDYGRTWTAWQTVEITAPQDEQEYIERMIRYILHGKALMAELRLTNPFVFERFFILFNETNHSLKYDH